MSEVRNDTGVTTGETIICPFKALRHPTVIIRNCALYDKFTDIRQQNKYLLEYIGYMFRPVNRSSSCHQYSESEVLFRHWDPNIYNCKQYKILNM